MRTFQQEEEERKHRDEEAGNEMRSGQTGLGGRPADIATAAADGIPRLLKYSVNWLSVMWKVLRIQSRTWSMPSPSWTVRSGSWLAN